MAGGEYIYLNRDLSWLGFNQRVLMEAADPAVPLYNRVQFLSIFSSNLDEFFRVRMPAIFAFSGLTTKKISLEEEYPNDLAMQVQKTVYGQLEEFGRILREEIIPGLKQQQVQLCYDEPLSAGDAENSRDYFLSRVLTYLQPVILKKAKQGTVFLENNALYFIVALQSPGKRTSQSYALLNIPSGLVPRFLEMTGQEGLLRIVFLDDVIREMLPEVFPGYRTGGAWSIKLTRHADMNLEDEFTGDIAEKIERQLEKRDTGPATRLLIDPKMPAKTRKFVQQFFELDQREIVSGGRYHNLKDLALLPAPKHPGSVQAPWPPLSHPGFDTHRTVFDCIKERERLLHLPYHSYHPVLRFFNEAAVDPMVREIYITLYRVATDSHIVNALISAARNGKKVTVFVELKARFDEANNLKWSGKMKAAGIRIIQSIPRLKVHAKVAMLRREENKKLVDYSFLGTGNFNESTGRFYTDHALFTRNREFGRELGLLFSGLQTGTRPELLGKIPFRRLLVSQFNMRDRFEKLIRKEIGRAQKGETASIILKLNNLQERGMIDLLYEASNAGVEVRLLVRSICCLAPGVGGQSENIRVTRIVDRYLEHARVFIFHNGGDPLCYLGSADWMNRNLHSRIEVCFPLKDPLLKKQIMDIVDLQLQDSVKAVQLTAEGENKRSAPGDAEIQAQQAIYEYVKTLPTVR
ncbi:MAG: polyphosphate kinase 1 [Sphingobacteriales bacterium]|nr:polyphosphate kinase 1 [Sphingobacteriales bacterium]